MHADHLRRRPGRGARVIARLGPVRNLARIDALDIVAAVAVAFGCSGEPLRRASNAPRAVGHRDIVTSVLVIDHDTSQEAGFTRGAPLTGSVPVVDDADRERLTSLNQARDVGRFGSSPRQGRRKQPAVSGLPIQIELVLLARGHVNAGTHDRARADRDFFARERVVVRLGRLSANPARRPVAIADARVEARGCGPR